MSEYEVTHNHPVNAPRSWPANPITLLAKPTKAQYLTFLASWLAWTADAFDFFAVSLNVSSIATTFGKSNSDVTLAITLTLLFRSVGAIIFGLAGDRWGRKWPMVVDIVLFGLLSMATGFCKNFSAFLAIRSLYGIALGGIYGCAASVALENLPHECRGLFSGILQQGYAMGYLIAAALNLAIVDNSPHGWRAIFWFSIGPAILVAIFRAWLPDEDKIKRDKLVEMGAHIPTSEERGKAFSAELKYVFKNHWIRLIHAVLLMAGFNFMSHGTQDLYPTFLKVQLGYSPDIVTAVTCIFNFGAIVGGTFAGYYSQAFGRRLTIIVLCVCGGALIPLWFLPKDWRVLAVGAFWLQFCVQGAWGVIPVHLNEISPSFSLRAAFVGISYQLGNAASSASSTIEARLGEHIKTTLNGKAVPNYGKVQALFAGCVFAFVIIMTAISPEYRGAAFENTVHTGDEAKVAGAGGENDLKDGDVEMASVGKMEMAHVERMNSRE
ncbi:Carboxylic acid transporter [Saitoella coloradoensis]